MSPARPSIAVAGTVSLAVVAPAGRVRGLGPTIAHRSASVSEATLMVAVLRRAWRGRLSARNRLLLRPMVMRRLRDGGWRAGVSHQDGLMARGRRRVGLGVLCSGSPSAAYGQATIEDIARRVLG